jgi:hypothetical protein
MEVVNSTMIYLLYCVQFFKCQNVLPAQFNLKKSEGSRTWPKYTMCTYEKDIMKLMYKTVRKLKKGMWRRGDKKITQGL